MFEDSLVPWRDVFGSDPSQGTPAVADNLAEDGKPKKEEQEETPKGGDGDPPHGASAVADQSAREFVPIWDVEEQNEEEKEEDKEATQKKGVQEEAGKDDAKEGDAEEGAARPLDVFPKVKQKVADLSWWVCGVHQIVIWVGTARTGMQDACWVPKSQLARTN